MPASRRYGVRLPAAGNFARSCDPRRTPGNRRDSLARRSPLMNRFPLFMSDHVALRIRLQPEHGSADIARGPRARAMSSLDTNSSLSIVLSFWSMGGENSITTSGDYWVTADTGVAVRPLRQHNAGNSAMRPRSRL